MFKEHILLLTARLCGKSSEKFTNPTKRKVKPFVIGRKNWLFAGNTRGAKASANLYSLIESAKAHDLKVFEYLKYVYDYLGSAKSDKDYEAFTPQFVRENAQIWFLRVAVESQKNLKSQAPLKK